jgi:integrase/recombinase XerC
VAIGSTPAQGKAVAGVVRAFLQTAPAAWTRDPGQAVGAYLAAFIAPPAQPTLLPGIVAQEPTEAALGRLLRLDAGRANDLVLRWRRDMQRRKLAPSTVNRRLAAVRTLTACARMLGMIAWEICVPGVHCITMKDTRGPGAEAAGRMIAACGGEEAGPASPRAATPREATRGRGETEPDTVGPDGPTAPSPHGPADPRLAARNRAILALLTYLALRREEVCTLDAADVDLAGSRIWVLRKGYEEKQVLSLPKAAVPPLEAWLAARGLLQGIDATDALFVGLDHPGRFGHLDGSSIYRMVRKAGAAAGVPKARPHGLRHTGITQAVEAATEAGLSLDEVRQFSGHKHLATLLRYRDQVRDVQGQLAEAVARRVKRAGQKVSDCHRVGAISGSQSEPRVRSGGPECRPPGTSEPLQCREPVLVVPSKDVSACQ